MKRLNSGAYRGNDGELKFYEMKGVKGTIVAKINQGMSSRVKTSAEYANTRLNNAEFGAAGNMAGAICKALTQRWRSITVPFATAKLLPKIKLEMGKDTTNPWGQRSLTGTGWQDQLRQDINALSKVSFDEEIGDVVIVRRDDDDNLVVELDGDIAQGVALASRGVDGIMFDVHIVKVSAPTYDNNLNGYTSSQIETFGSDTADDSLDESLSEAFDYNNTVAVVDGTHSLACAIVVAKPYRTIGGVKYIAQEFCCHKMFALPEVA